LTTGAKVAIGCGVAFVVVGMGVAAAVFGGLWWAKGKAEQFTANENRIEDLRKKANAVPFTLPADGLIREDRLEKFLDVRKRVFAVYLKHKDEMDAISKKEKGDLSTLTTGMGILNEARMARAEALADAGMSEDEYNYLVGQIYKTMWNSEIAKESGGKTPSEMIGQAADQTAESMARSGETADKLKGVDTSKLTPEQREQMEATRKMLEEMQKNSGQAKQRAAEARARAKEAMDVPPENIALFRKHEAEIKKYAMAGMEWMGL
jgi:hypothetical protein